MQKHKFITPKRILILYLFLFLFMLTVLITVSIRLSYTHLDITTCSVSSTKLTAPVTAVVLSDLHDHEFGEDNHELVSMVAEQHPDMILLAGDFVNDVSADADVTIRLVEQLAEIAPVYFSLGNHELAYMQNNIEKNAGLISLLTEAGAVVLDKEWQDIEINGQMIRIGGMYDYAFATDGHDSTNPKTMDPAVYQFLTEFVDEESVADKFTIMMAHRPESFVLGQASVTWDVDLVVSGHDHGGQVILPFLGGLWAGDQGWFPQYVHGLHEKDLITIFITRGLGSNEQKLPRFNNLPEVAVIKLEPSNKQ